MNSAMVITQRPMARGLLVLGSMMRTSFFSSRATLWIVLVMVSTVCAQQEWFGSNNQYKCHCTNNNCDSDGNCISGGCVKGWFGPQCQYVDFSYTENDGTTSLQFLDADDTTCNSDPSHQTVTISFRRTIPFTWLRLVVIEEGLPLDNIEVKFTDDNDNNNIQCNNKRSALVDSRTIDIHCDVSVEVKKVWVTGDAIGYLCSFYVSGGRNVALKQNATQSTTESAFKPERAVDGNINQDFNGGQSCSHTAQSSDFNPSWDVTFSQNFEVNRFVIYNRVDCCPKRLQDFTLTSRDTNRAPVFSYQDTGTTALSIYTVTTATLTLPVRSVVISTSHVDDSTSISPILTLCEVEIYGDTICPVGQYGRECDQECHCTNNEPCFVTTGRCANGCAAGYTGEHCDQTCPFGFYGAGCTTPCNQNCDRGCQADNGYCIECKAGWQGTVCNIECDATKYGKGCKNQCSTNCKDQQCDRVDGKCVSCVSGKMGDYCNTDCRKTMYGPGCTNQCSSVCASGECNGITGTCDNCPDGKEGDQCEKDCDATFYGPRCIHQCSQSCVDRLCNRINGTCDTCPSGKTGDQCQEECFPTTYGPRCIHQCSTTCVDNICNGSTGFCVRCPDGKFGDYCDRDCPEGTYGLECKFTCSDNCKVPKDCDSVNGTCQGGCTDGYRGDRCDDADCPRGKYGVTCDQVCNQNCRNRDCDSDTGQCKVGCVPGYYGNMCETQCEPGKYGTDCSSDCSEFCNTNGTRENESPCHPVSGTCSYGCVHGYGGLKCDAKAQSSSSDSEPGVGVGVGIGVGVTVLVLIVVLAILGVYFYRRHKSAQKSRRERPPGYDPAEPTTEEHNYSELFRSDDGYNLPTDVASSAVTFKSPSNSRPDTVQYVNADVNEDVNDDTVQDDLKTDVTPYEDIDRITSEKDQVRKPNPGEDNTGYANTGYTSSGYANTGYANF